MLLNKHVPYVGVCGITSVSESNHIALMLAEGAIPGKQVMVGVRFVNERRQSEHYARYPNRYPHAGVIKEILSPLLHPWARGKCVAALHYESCVKSFAPDLLYVLGGFHGLVQAVQLNIDAPERVEVATLARVMRGKIPGFRIILRVGMSRFREWEERGDPTSHFLTHIDRYHDIVNDVLLDVSGEFVEALDGAWFQKYLEVFFRWKRLYGHFPNTGIGLSVDFHPLFRRKFSGVWRFAQQYPELSVSIEGDVRTSDDCAIDLSALTQWLIANGGRGMQYLPSISE